MNNPPAPHLNGDASKNKYALERALIDESARGPVLFFFGTSLFWLLVGTVLAVIASYKMYTPEFLADYPWLTFGRGRTVKHPQGPSGSTFPIIQ